MKILLAEDDPHIMVVAKMALERMGGHQVTHVTNGEQAITEALANSYDLILLDSMMPGKDGLTACRELKGQHGIETPIVFLSAKSQEADIREGLNSGAIGYIQKPFDPKTICGLLDDILSQSIGGMAA